MSRKMQPMEDELFPSTPGKFKDRSNRQFHRCFTSTSTMFLWALFLIALTASYLSFHSFISTSSKYFSTTWGGIQWERQVRSSAELRRPNGVSVLVTVPRQNTDQFKPPSDTFAQRGDNQDNIITASLRSAVFGTHNV
ncbi:epimerase/racemase [Lithospermum erythrorhizon]|uniref:Epimerase/racemase n=1 Tax=Lithospermum erythrorhizon TaxID=34254 RepID=A0AAV3P7Z7_LITER